MFICILISIILAFITYTVHVNTVDHNEYQKLHIWQLLLGIVVFIVPVLNVVVFIFGAVVYIGEVEGLYSTMKFKPKGWLKSFFDTLNRTL